MRLSKSEIAQIIKALTPFIHKQKVELRLYGSRIKNNLKGGDIDLLLLVDKQEVVKALLAQKHEILAQIKNLIGEQRIDLKIAYKQEIKEDVFLKLIIPTSIILHQWH